jgi:hypothetical protein
MERKRNPRALAAAVCGVAGAAGLAACGWYGIRLLMLEGPPVRRELWPPYLLILAGTVVSGAIVYASFRLLDRWGVRPPA